MSIESVSTSNLPEPAYLNHGKTRSAWVANGGTVVGTLIAGWGFTFWDMMFVAIGGGVIAVAWITAAVLKALGHGQGSREGRAGRARPTLTIKGDRQ